MRNPLLQLGLSSWMRVWTDTFHHRTIQTASITEDMPEPSTAVEDQEEDQEGSQREPEREDNSAGLKGRREVPERLERKNK